MKILSWNIRGLNSPYKQFLIKLCISDNKVDILLLQETKMKKEVFEKDVLKIWPNANYFLSYVEGASGGIATLWNPLEFKGSLGFFGKSNLMASLEDQSSLEKWNLFNIYAPNFSRDKL